MRKGASEERSNSSGSLAPLRPVMAPFKVIRTGGSVREGVEASHIPMQAPPRSRRLLPEELKPLNNKYQGKEREWMQRLPISKVKEGIYIKEEAAPNGLQQHKRKRQSRILRFLLSKARLGS